MVNPLKEVLIAHIKARSDYERATMSPWTVKIKTPYPPTYISAISPMFLAEWETSNSVFLK